MSKSKNKSNIMVVDDTPANLSLLTNILQNAGYRVLAFPRADLAMDAALTNPPDIILLDIMMPECNGFEFCAMLKNHKSLKTLPVIFISALQDTENKVQAFTRGGVDYVTKPFEEAEILARIRTHLEISQQKKLLEAQQKKLVLNYKRLRKTEEQRDALVHMLAHDMQSPLFGIRGYAELIKSKLDNLPDADLSVFPERIIMASDWLQNMVRNILDTSRMEADSMPLHKKKCSLPDLIVESISGLGTLAQSHTIVTEKNEGLVPVLCDPEITIRVIQNLLTNAIKFSPKVNPITIRFITHNQNPGLAICDTGHGIPRDAQKSIFNKYSQLKEGIKHRRKSSGLGLAFCKLAMDAQNGEIGVISDGNSGSTFWFTLPPFTPVD